MHFILSLKVILQNVINLCGVLEQDKQSKNNEKTKQSDLRKNSKKANLS